MQVEHTPDRDLAPALASLPVAVKLQGSQPQIQRKGDGQLHRELLPAVTSYSMRHLVTNDSGQQVFLPVQQPDQACTVPALPV